MLLGSGKASIESTQTPVDTTVIATTILIAQSTFDRARRELRARQARIEAAKPEQQAQLSQTR